MSKRKKLGYLVTCMMLGLIFVLFPRQNTPYSGTIDRSEWPFCVGSNVYDYGNGVQKTGFPVVNRTVYIGPCVSTENPLINYGKVLDFCVGFLVGLAGLLSVSLIHKNRAKD